MKNLYIVALFFSFCLFTFNASGTESLYSEKKVQSKIALTQSGSSAGEGRLRSSAIIPLEVYQETNHLLVNFLNTLGAVNIVITNEQGYPVYQQNVNAVAENTLTIPTGSFASGTYTITLTYSSGSLEGNFSI